MLLLPSQLMSSDEHAIIFPYFFIITQAAHFYWSMWALVQAHFSAIDFDFLG